MTVTIRVAPRPEEAEISERLHAGTNARRPTAFVFYHYFPPDEVVSAILIGEFSAGLAERGWSVTAFPCVWNWRDDSKRFAVSEQWQNVSVRRVWRPKFRQASGIGRILNALWMIARWSLLAIGRDSPDVVVIGTDSVLSILVARVEVPPSAYEDRALVLRSISGSSDRVRNLRLSFESSFIDLSPFASYFLF
jgi:hypothetical protein